MHSLWESLWLGIGSFAEPSGDFHGLHRAGGDRMKPSPVLELAWIDGKPVIMGRNQTMKMLIQAPLPAPRRSLFRLPAKLRMPPAPRNSPRPSR